MNCPKCSGKTLEHLSVPFNDPKGQEGKLDLDRCPMCSGTWFDKGEIEQYLTARTEDAPSAGLSSIVGQANNRKPGNCPRCSVAMEPSPSRVKTNIQVDRCGKCSGVWFDGGELALAGKDTAAIAAKFKEAFGNL